MSEYLTDGEWREHDGGRCPIPFGTPIIVKRRNGIKHYREASKWDGWSDTGHATDIVAYSLARTHTEDRAK